MQRCDEAQLYALALESVLLADTIYCLDLENRYRGTGSDVGELFQLRQGCRRITRGRYRETMSPNDRPSWS